MCSSSLSMGNLVANQQLNIVAARRSSCGRWRISRVGSKRTNFDALASRVQDFTVAGDIATCILSAVESKKVKPDNRVGSCSAMTPVPAPESGTQRHVSPVLDKGQYVSKRIVRLIISSELTLSWYPVPENSTTVPDQLK